MLRSDASGGTWRVRAALVALGVLAAGSPLWAGKVETWRQGSSSDFGAGKKEGVIVTEQGRVRLSLGVEPLGAIAAAQVWDLARSKGGTLYAATGNEGKVFRLEADGSWSLAFDADEAEVFSLAAAPDGRVFAGTGPGGRVVELTDPEHPSTRPAPGVEYIWDLAAAPDGTLYAATGPEGGLYRREADGSWSLRLDSPHPHLLSIAVAADGDVLAGSDGEGLIYRITPGGDVSVAFDAPQDEVRCLLAAPDGRLYAGTAAAPGGGPGGSPPRNPGGSSADLPGRPGDGPRVASVDPGVASVDPGVARASLAVAARDDARPDSRSGGTATPRPPGTGENSVYVLDGDGVREIFRDRLLIFAMALRGDSLLVGTGPEGRLFEVLDGGRDSAELARLDHGQVLAMLNEPGGATLLGAGDPGGVLRLARGHVAEGTLTSDVLDAKLPSRFGALTWRAEVPAGTALAMQLRTGNAKEPDATWSDWSPPLSDPAGDRAEVSAGRFAQYRIRLTTDRPAATPELASVALHYQTINLPPELSKIEVPDLSAGDGDSKSAELTIKWTADDPNGDDLAYTLALRKDDWPDWVPLNHEPLTETTFKWDSTSVPSGLYRLRLSATDRPSNPPEQAVGRDLQSETFVVDHDAPVVAVTVREGKATVTLKDAQTRLVRAESALDGGDWEAAFPDDGLFDAPSESLTVALPDLKAGTHVLRLRATDAAGNVGAGDAIFRIP